MEIYRKILTYVKENLIPVILNKVKEENKININNEINKYFIVDNENHIVNLRNYVTIITLLNLIKNMHKIKVVDKKLDQILKFGYDKYYFETIVLQRRKRIASLSKSNSSFDIFYAPFDFKILTELPFYTCVGFENKTPYFGSLNELSNLGKSYEVFMFGINEVEISNVFSNKINQNCLSHVIIHDLVYKINTASFVESIFEKIYIPNIVEMEDNSLINCKNLTYIQMIPPIEIFDKDKIIYGIKNENLKYNLINYERKHIDEFNIDMFKFQLKLFEYMFIDNRINIQYRTKIIKRYMNLYELITKMNNNKETIVEFKNNSKIISSLINSLLSYTTITTPLIEIKNEIKKQITTDVKSEVKNEVKIPDFILEDLTYKPKTSFNLKYSTQSDSDDYTKPNIITSDSSEYFKQLKKLKDTVIKQDETIKSLKDVIVKQNEDIEFLKRQNIETRKRLGIILSIMCNDFNKGDRIKKELEMLNATAKSQSSSQ